jgi:hypothetical protein
MTATMIKRVAFFQALLPEPEDHFVIGDNGSANAPDDIGSIGDVVGVAMGDEDIISRNPLYIDLAGQFVSANERVEQEVFAADFHPEA